MAKGTTARIGSPRSSALPLLLLTCIGTWAAQAAPTVSVSASDATAAELGSSGEFTFSLSEPVPDVTLSVTLDVSGSATPGEDYTALAQSIQFPPGSVTQTIRVTPIADTAQEGDETVVVSVVAGENYELGTPASATVTISDLQQPQRLPTVSIRRDSSDPREGSDEAGYFVVELSETAGSAGLDIGLETLGSATAGQADGADFAALPSSIRINSGERSARIRVEVFDDSSAEIPESIIARLVSGEGYQLASSREASLFIIDNDSGSDANGGAPGASGAPGVIAAIEDTDLRTAATNGTERLTVRVVDGTGAPVSAVAMQWQLDADGSAAGGVLSAADAFTNSDGQASVTLSTGALPAAYSVAITATGTVGGQTTTLNATMQVMAGLANVVALNTPEGAIALTLDTVCRRLNLGSSLSNDEQALLARCNELLTAAENGETAAVSNALRRIAPEEVAAQRRVSRQVAERAMGDVYTRLHQLRHGARGVQLDGLSLRTSEGTLSGDVLARMLSAQVRGGAAGDEPLWQSDRWGLFVTGHFGQAERDRTAKESGYDADSQGLTFGADYRHSDRLVYGAALNYGTTDTSMSDNAGSLDTSGFGFSVYGTYFHTEQIYFEGIVGLGNHDFDTLRRVDYVLNSASVSREAKGSTAGAHQSLAIGAGYEQLLAGGVTIDWSGRVSFITHDIDAYSESGASEFDLRIDSQSYESLTFSLGGQIQKAFSTSYGVVLPMARLQWEHDTKGAHEIGGSFVADSQSTPFSFDSDAWDKDYLRAAAGLSAILRNGTTVFVSYDTVLQRDHYSEGELAFGARWQKNF